jgi:hypothetical protein
MTSYMLPQADRSAKVSDPVHLQTAWFTLLAPSHDRGILDHRR